MSDERLAQLISEVIGIDPKEEFALFYGGGEWVAEWKNECAHVRLGESDGEFQSAGCPTPEEAVLDLLMSIRMDYEPANPPSTPAAL